MSTIVLGQFVKPVGLRGQLKLRESADFWEEALSSQKLKVELDRVQRPVLVAQSRIHRSGTRILTLEGVADRTEAESLVGAELLLDRDDLDVEEPDSVRPFQVLGVEVFLPDGERLGTVEDLLRMPANDVFVVQGEKKEYLIPDAPHIVEDLDLKEKRMRIRPLPGLLEL